MFFHHHEINFFETISRTVFLTAAISFVVFLAFDLLIPGFVSRVFSVHWFLLVALISGFCWGSVVKDSK
ncbi:MAG: hypothetical protein V1664_02675 [Candidatus Uhrbacteria bacterium]